MAPPQPGRATGRRRRASARALVALRAALLALCLPGLAGAQDESLEAPIKATFLHRFGDFVDWPEGAFEVPLGAMTICVVGEDPFGQIMEAVVRDQLSHGRPIRLRRIPVLDAQQGCHIAYLAGSRRQSVGEALEATRGVPVLTVTDEASGDDARGVIHFEIVDNRVRFHIDELAADRRGLSVSSRLLALAVTVHRRSEP